MGFPFPPVAEGIIDTARQPAVFLAHGADPKVPRRLVDASASLFIKWVT
jgi:hypothetical protein